MSDHDAATGVEECGCQPARRFLCPEHRIAAAEAERDAYRSRLATAEAALDAATFAAARRELLTAEALDQRDAARAEVARLREALSVALFGMEQLTWEVQIGPNVDDTVTCCIFCDRSEEHEDACPVGVQIALDAKGTP